MTTLSDAELDALLLEINTLATVPGGVTRALGDESVALTKTGTASRKPRAKKIDVTDLL